MFSLMSKIYCISLMTQKDNNQKKNKTWSEEY